ncbi:MAG: Rrf2 family transcriptional regulator [Planctomycetota bacterium]|nr:Rrf2 family transcriptional regulator [Planctomycetota bacterium]
MRFLSDACEYGLRATVWLAQRAGTTQKVREIAEGTQSTPGYLVKVLQRLAKAGILSAQRGSQGGFTLEHSPDDITVLDIINAVDPLERIQTCPLGLDAHGQHLCPLHRRIDDAMATIEESFGTVTIAEMISESSRSRPLCNGLEVERSRPTQEEK